MRGEFPCGSREAPTTTASVVKFVCTNRGGTPPAGIITIAKLGGHSIGLLIYSD